MLHLQDSLTGEKRKFIPLIENKVGIYVCGVTLYDHIHIGHLKSILTFEILRNYFKQKNFEVKFVRNITDIDDKIIDKALKESKEPLELVNHYIDVYHNLLNSLEINPPDEEPRVTDFLPQIEQYIQDLEDKGFAYKAEDGIYFNTETIKEEVYPLSKKVVKDLLESEENKIYNKINKADFALWKKDTKHGYKSKIFDNQGRPGWHIECSVMHHHTLGEKFDIHGGGRDLIFPHHENEITQSIAHNGVNPANYWIHNGMMTKDGKKLSKSLGNSIYVNDLLKDYIAEGLKLFLLKGQYNKSQEFSIEELKEAHYRILSFMKALGEINDSNETLDTNYIQLAIEYLEDNLNTPRLVALIYELINKFNEKPVKNLALEIIHILKLVSVIGKNSSIESLYAKWKQYKEENSQYSIEVINLVEKRKEAKLNKDWVLSDIIRKEVESLGWKIKDLKDNSYEIIKLD